MTIPQDALPRTDPMAGVTTVEPSSSAGPQVSGATVELEAIQVFRPSLWAHVVGILIQAWWWLLAAWVWTASGTSLPLGLLAVLFGCMAIHLVIHVHEAWLRVECHADHLRVIRPWGCTRIPFGDIVSISCHARTGAVICRGQRRRPYFVMTTRGAFHRLSKLRDVVEARQQAIQAARQAAFRARWQAVLEI